MSDGARSDAVWASAASNWVYVVTDIEVDGPHPGPNSMRSFASVAVSADGTKHGSFEAVLEPLPGAAPNPHTYEWFQTQPEAWRACTTDPQSVTTTMAAYASWLCGLPAPRTFVACPLGFDGTWVDYYLRRFTAFGLAQGPYEADRVFHNAGVCLSSYAAACTNAPPCDFHPSQLPPSLLGNVPHTHRAIDDALGYANLLVNLLSGHRL